MERLLAYRFEWVLPGHGRIHRTAPDRMRRDLARCIERMHTKAGVESAAAL